MTIYEAMKKANVNDVKISAVDLSKVLVSTLTSADFKHEGATGTMTWDESGACKKSPQIVELNK